MFGWYRTILVLKVLSVIIKSKLFHVGWQVLHGLLHVFPALCDQAGSFCLLLAIESDFRHYSTG